MADRKLYQDSIIPLPAAPGVTPGGLTVNAAMPNQPDDSLEVHFSLNVAPDVQAKLEETVAKGQVISPADLDKLYTTKPEDTQALKQWLNSNGYQITGTSRDGIYARAKASQIGKSLEVNMVPVTKDGVTYMSAQDSPSLPADVATAVRSINGLQPFRQANKHLRSMQPVQGNGAGAGAAVVPGPAPAIANAPPYLVSEILGAYGATGLGVDGGGQTIAILIDTVPNAADLAAFWVKNGVAVNPARIEEINVGGGTLPAPSGEETLDVSWASGIAPGANIRIYASGALTFVALDKAIDRIISDLQAFPGMRQLSISLGLGETFMAPAEVTTQHIKFLQLAAVGVNVFCSSGDAGSNPDSTGHNPTGPLQAEYEASDPCVVGVGGTTLRLAANGAVASETGWSASGGGTSRFFPRPAWQTGAGVPHGNMRVIPDVSAAADPNTGAFLVLNGTPTQIGGTSWSAPVWAGFCALMNEARQKGGKPLLGFLNPLIYPLLGTPAFRDIVAGSNGAFHCGKGYDEVTGLGSPSVKELIARLN
jgi:kumamolisin